jgi:hypothetical protein
MLQRPHRVHLQRRQQWMLSPVETARPYGIRFTLAQKEPMKAELTSTGATATFHGNHHTHPVTYTLPLHTAWGERVDLIEPQPGSKTRPAFVYAKTYGQSKHWDEVLLRVRVPSNLPDKEAAHLAAHKARARVTGYSWVMWARKRICEKYESLADVAEFSQALKNLSAEWMPRTSPEGRAHVEQVLKLGSFTSSAYPARQ